MQWQHMQLYHSIMIPSLCRPESREAHALEAEMRICWDFMLLFFQQDLAILCGLMPFQRIDHYGCDCSVGPLNARSLDVVYFTDFRYFPATYPSSVSFVLA